MNLFDPMHLDIISSRFDIERQQNIFAWYILWELVLTFLCFCFSCAACYMYFFFLENTLYMYINFDNTDNTWILAVSILIAFKIQDCFTRRYAQSAKRLISICVDKDLDRVNLEKLPCFFKGTLKWSNASVLVWEILHHFEQKRHGLTTN